MNKLKEFKLWLTWRRIGPHLCTLAVASSFNSTWRAPREAFRYGGLQSLLLTTVASVVIALPVVLLQLAVGQLSQQDAVGIWRAVPFFKGVGYLRLLISFICSTYSLIYVATSVIYMFYTLKNSTPRWECVVATMPSDIMGEVDDELTHYNVTDCMTEAFLAPVSQQAEYYVALTFIVIGLWILFPFIIYNPVKLMKRTLYALGLLVFLLEFVILVAIGNINYLTQFSKDSDWSNFVQPNIWHGALVQALFSSHIAGGYLFTAGDSIYSETNIQWTSIIFVAINIIANWFGVLFWFAIGGDKEKMTSNLAVLAQVYKATGENNMSVVWSVICFVMISLSGFISMITFLHPLYDRFRRVGGYKWRNVSVVSSGVGAAGGLALVATTHSLTVLEDLVVPCLVTVVTVVEIAAFVLVYGWKPLAEDIEFLTENKLNKIWVGGWCLVSVVIVPISLWWSIYWFLQNNAWTEAPWEAACIVASYSAAFILFCIFAVISVVRQVQFDFIGKLSSSFQPSRHWGPRDPITHHYWLSKREDTNQIENQSWYRRRQLGEFSGVSSVADVLRLSEVSEVSPTMIKRRADSDDWLFTHRRQCVAESCEEKYGTRRHTKSLDCVDLPRVKFQRDDSSQFDYSHQNNEEINGDSSSVSISSVWHTTDVLVFDAKRDLHV